MISACLAILPLALNTPQGQAPAKAAPENPYQLPIGMPGRIKPALGLTHSATGRQSSMKEIVEAARGYRFVMVGESHDNPDHHKFQADVIRALAADGREVSVGLEMFTRDNQAAMFPWSRGFWTDEEFQAKANWKTQWGFDYALYKPIFDTVKELKLPMAALNLPREWVRRVGREGIGALTPEEKKWAPNVNLDNLNHRRLFVAMIGGHPLEGKRGDNMISAQVSWDESMAQSAVDFMAPRVSRNAVMVVIAGSGHTMYGQGINYRLKKKGFDSLNLVGLEQPLPEDGISKGLADFVFVSPQLERKPSAPAK